MKNNLKIDTRTPLEMEQELEVLRLKKRGIIPKEIANLITTFLF